MTQHEENCLSSILEKALAWSDVSLVWEEHVNYFTRGVLEELLARHGFEALQWGDYSYAGSTMAVLARRGPAPQRVAEPARILQEGAAFAGRLTKLGRELRAVLAQARALGHRIVLYGAGCRATLAVNAHGLGPLIDYVVDDLPVRQGLFLAGSHLPICPSGRLHAEAVPVLCLLAVNEENEAKVKARSGAGSIRYLSLVSPGDVPDKLLACEVQASGA